MENRTLSFTIVAGHLKGEHSCAFEVHATGCRDLQKLQRTQFNYSLEARTPGAAVTQAITDANDTTRRSDYWVQPCCSLVRMKAIGRAPADYDPSAPTEVTEDIEEQVAYDMALGEIVEEVAEVIAAVFEPTPLQRPTETFEEMDARIAAEVAADDE